MEKRWMLSRGSGIWGWRGVPVRGAPGSLVMIQSIAWSWWWLHEATGERKLWATQTHTASTCTTREVWRGSEDGTSGCFLLLQFGVTRNKAPVNIFVWSFCGHTFHCSWGNSHCWVIDIFNLIFLNDFHFFHYSWFTVFCQFSIVQESDPVTHAYIRILFLTLSSITLHHQWLGTVPRAIEQELIAYPFQMQ